MTPAQFRLLALDLPEAVQGEHMGTPDFRVRGRIFATLGSGANARCVVKLAPGEQEMFMRVEPDAFEPVTGGWGRKGWTRVDLSRVEEPLARDALVTAWRNVAPKKLAATLKYVGAGIE